MKMENDFILEPDPSRIMEGLRDTGYDFNTAMADLVDNSISANATIISVNVNLDPNGEIKVFIADNGEGMDIDGLKNAMRYGSEKRKDPSSLGKFGLGLKTASTAFCRSLSLVSKTSTSDYNKVCWDLDYICEVNRWQLLVPEIAEDEIEILESVSNGSSGTLVIWDKVDRLMKTYSNNGSLKNAYNRVVNNLKKHFSMVYQRFLDCDYTKKPITILLNGIKVEPWDPFCKKEPNTQILADNNQKVEFEDGKTSQFHIAAYLLPRVGEWSSNEAKSNAMVSNDMEGFYIYRENRLIHYGDWLGIFTNDPHISLLRVEFSFDHELDDLFNVDIKKSRIILNEDIYDFLKRNFLPAPRNAANDLYRAAQSSNIAKKAADKHQESNETIDSKAKSLIKSKVSVIDASTGKVEIQNNRGTFTGTLKIIEGEQQKNHRVIPINESDSNFLWKPTLSNQEHAVTINTTHPFYGKVYARIIDNDIVAGIDYLLWALSEAELSTYSEDAKEQYEDMRYQTSKALRKLVESLPDPDLGDE